jgi:GNAT superfamily N-acetyltransferase
MALAVMPSAGDDRGVIDDDIRVRRIRSSDAAGLACLYAGLSEESRCRRFHQPSHALTNREAAAFAGVDHRHRDGFVAVRGSQVVGHLALEPRGHDVDELAVVVDDRIQRRGVGTLLLAAALASARLRGTAVILAWIWAENLVARHLMESTRHPTRRFWEGQVARYEIFVPPRPRSPSDPAQTHLRRRRLGNG